MELNADGSMKDKTFSGDNYQGEYPYPKKYETYREYRKRIDKLIPDGFHLGDLSWDDWIIYCKGSGSYEGVNSDEIIGSDTEDDYDFLL